MKLTYSLLPTSRTSMQFNIHGDQLQFCRFDGQMMPVEDVVSVLIRAGMTTEEIGFWLECRMAVGTYAPLTAVIQ